MFLLLHLGYDYTDLEVNPLCPLDEPMDPGMPMQGARPEWSIVGKCNANMETILFREKFTKWPDGGKLIKMKGKDNDNEGKETEALNLIPADVAPMLADDMTDANLALEGKPLGWHNIGKSSLMKELSAFPILSV